MQSWGSTMKINSETKRELLKIGAEYTLKDGKERTLEDIVKLLIEEHRKWLNYLITSNLSYFEKDRMGVSKEIYKFRETG